MTFWEKLKLIGSKIFQFFLPLIQRFVQESGPIILAMALKYVPQIAATMGDKDGEEKRKAVVALMLAECKEKGIAVSMSMINAAIEIAYTYLKPKGEV
jgi:hypothetical protein